MSPSISFAGNNKISDTVKDSLKSAWSAAGKESGSLILYSREEEAARKAAEEAERKRKAAEDEKAREAQQGNGDDFEKALTKWGKKRDDVAIILNNKGITDDDCNLVAAIIRENKNLKELNLCEYEWNHSQLTGLN